MIFHVKVCRHPCQCAPAYLKRVHFSVVKKHEDGHLEGRDLQDVLAGVKANHLSTSHTHV